MAGRIDLSCLSRDAATLGCAEDEQSFCDAAMGAEFPLPAVQDVSRDVAAPVGR